MTMDQERDIRGAVAVVLHLLTAQREAIPDVPGVGPYPGTVSEVADEIARFVLELESSGVARGVLHGVINTLNGEYAKRNRPGGTGAGPARDCTHGVDCTVHPDANALHNLDEIEAHEVRTCRACPPECRECTGRNEDCECYTHVPPLHGTYIAPVGTPEPEWVGEGELAYVWGCRTCEYDVHTCPGCGDAIMHGQATCGECR